MRNSTTRVVSPLEMEAAESGLETARRGGDGREQVKNDRAIFVSLVMVVFVAVTAIATIVNRVDIQLSEMDSLAITAITICYVVCLLVEDGFGIVIDISRPLGLFALFYLCYYILPDWLVVITNASASRNCLEISALAAFGLACTALGIKLSGFRRIELPRLSRGQCRALLTICVLMVPLLVWYYSWRISNGTFYLHGQYFEQDTTIFAGLMENAIKPLQLPVILILGLVLRSVQGREYTAVKRFLFTYTALSVIVYVASSQFRPLAAAFLFCIASLNFSSARPVKLKTHLVIGFACGALLIAILAVRTAMSDLPQGGKLSSLSSSSISSEQASEEWQATTSSRMLNQQTLLSNIMDDIHAGHSYLYGALLLTSAYSVIPRMLWPAKPVVTPMQLLIRLEFDMSPRDDAVGPLLEFYANGGWIAVAIGFTLLGIFIGFSTKSAMRRHGLLACITICWLWYVMSTLDGEIVLPLLAQFRLILGVAFFAWCVEKRVFSTPLRILIAAIFPVWIFLPSMRKAKT